jgi:hypothetical protein
MADPELGEPGLRREVDARRAGTSIHAGLPSASSFVIPPSSSVIALCKSSSPPGRRCTVMLRGSGNGNDHTHPPVQRRKWWRGRTDARARIFPGVRVLSV